MVTEWYVMKLGPVQYSNRAMFDFESQINSKQMTYEVDSFIEMELRLVAEIIQSNHGNMVIAEALLKYETLDNY